MFREFQEQGNFEYLFHSWSCEIELNSFKITPMTFKRIEMKFEKFSYANTKNLQDFA